MPLLELLRVACMLSPQVLGSVLTCTDGSAVNSAASLTGKVIFFLLQHISHNKS